jgi:hypothetical protein
MTREKILFLRTIPVGRSRREQELARSAALSHAAKVSHRRKKEKEKSQTQQESLIVGGPLTILPGGNSDPFESLAVRVTPRVNEVISFVRDYFLPASYVTDSPAWIRAFGADKEWLDSVAVLRDECCARAFMLTYTTIIANLTRSDELNLEKLNLKGKSSVALRARIQKSPEGDAPVLTSMLFLFAAETFAGNHFEATIHGKTLRTLLYEKSQKEGSVSIEQGFLTRTLWYDVHLAESHMTRTIFDMDGWVTDTLGPTFKPVDKFLEPFSAEFTRNLDRSLDSEPLRTIFVQYRQALWLWTQPNPVADEDGWAASHWVLGRSYINQGRLVNYFLDVRQTLGMLGFRQATSTSITKITHDELFWYTQSCLALGMLYFLAPLGGDPSISGQPLLPTCKTLLLHLRATMAMVLRAWVDLSGESEPDLLHEFQNAHLWALFLGAQGEQRDSKTYPDPTKAWFNRALGSFLTRIRMSSWEMIREKLTLFIYSDFIMPNGSDWVWKVMVNTSAKPL